jgi:hypothetical protein
MIEFAGEEEKINSEKEGKRKGRKERKQGGRRGKERT